MVFIGIYLDPIQDRKKNTDVTSGRSPNWIFGEKRKWELQAGGLEK